MIDDLLDSLRDFVDDELRTPVTVEDCETFPSDFYVEARKWKRIEDVVVVVADLTDSTKLGFDKYVSTSASIYEAATGGAIRVVADAAFDPQFVDIQGDGFFALFHGERRYERAFAAAVTVKTFSERCLVPLIEQHLSAKTPKTGFKVGMASGILAVKRVGVRGTNEPVWAGKPVNWATKCAQAAERHELVVTERVWNRLKDNAYVTWSCGCSDDTPIGRYVNLWDTVQVQKLPTEDWSCHRLKSAWCVNCGEDFCVAILSGKRQRPELVLSS